MGFNLRSVVCDNCNIIVLFENFADFKHISEIDIFNNSIPIPDGWYITEKNYLYCSQCLRTKKIKILSNK